MNREHSSVGLRSKVIRTFFLFSAVMLAVLWLLQTVFLDNFYRLVRQRQLTSSAGYYISQFGADNYTELVKKDARSKDFCVIIASEKGIVCSEDVSAACMIHHMPGYDYTYFFQLAQENGGEYLLRLSPDGDGQAAELLDRGISETIVLTRLFTYNHVTYACIINAVLEPMDATESTLQEQLIPVSLIMVLLASVLSGFLSRRISRPLSLLNRKSRYLGRENAPDFTTRGYREVEELGNTLNQASTELQKTERLQRELIANISHDLRTPLTLIAGYAEVMRDLPGENTPENAQIIIDEAHRLTTLVNDVLDVSKISAGSEPFRPEVFDLTEETKTICLRLRRMTQRDGYHVHMKLPEFPVFVLGDRMMLSRAIYNLLTNAINHSGEGQNIVVTETVASNRVRISIEDDGPGIAPEQLDSIWERYYKIGKEHKRAAVGSGLGLPIVRKILQMHGATYGVESTQGVGSMFWFELPISKVEQ